MPSPEEKSQHKSASDVFARSADERLNLDVGKVQTTLGIQLYEARERAMLTRAELAKISGVKIKVIAEIEEANYDEFPLSSIVVLCRALNQEIGIKIEPTDDKTRITRESTLIAQLIDLTPDTTADNLSIQVLGQLRAIFEERFRSDLTKLEEALKRLELWRYGIELQKVLHHAGLEVEPPAVSWNDYFRDCPELVSRIGPLIVSAYQLQKLSEERALELAKKFGVPDLLTIAGSEWVRRMAELEDRFNSISVGGLAVDLGMPVKPPDTQDGDTQK